MASSETLAVKAGRHSSGINNLVWIGESVAMACNLANIANKEINNPILLSSNFHYNYSQYIEKNEETNKKVLSYFQMGKHERYGTFYHANIVKTDFNNWIENNMPV
ncbi:hypothetical protein [Enterococcus casseliflavus]|uniref:hypothetical protein n=1 Tax=Enterococcus casseliflavus TaxID=37734 RepID=UPI0018847595|nr:hypothetical protein [Enterococcus casseliflavus]MBE9908836.1 hypothetical protein [Enterococcus casseliflavus]